MRDRVILQIPISKSLRQEAQKVAEDLGFSSLQEIIRVILSKLSKRQLTFTIGQKEKAERLSPRAEKRYAKMIEDIKRGRNVYKPKDDEEFFKMLRS